MKQHEAKKKLRKAEEAKRKEKELSEKKRQRNMEKLLKSDLIAE